MSIGIIPLRNHRLKPFEKLTKIDIPIEYIFRELILRITFLHTH